ncbi:DUF362 domain-containing protein [Metallumcola ferriviriculae]|uniref:DUF362 domain-containing protein n=1 Tax=Metallumcola ferriviriculae TaxID=3039180 RepID=A0AAU0UQ72_9FIRM|nr:DUF362 domain-containing protein [Desulfitibacteraceae bacterium MK1]
MASEVFFTNMRAKRGASLLEKLELLCRRAKVLDVISEKDLVALKIHFGEKGNTAYIRPTYARRLIDLIKEKGGKPFFTDANTLYVGSRANAVDHLNTAVENGFAYSVVGAPLVIADGLNGKDFIKVPIEGKHFNEVNIGSAAVNADVLITLTHFKGHEATGFGGALKNVGMGLGSRSGKQQMHSDILPSVKLEKCIACQKCVSWCPAQAITVEKQATIDQEKCIGCGECTVTCNEGAIGISWKSEANIIQQKIAEYTLGALKNKQGKSFFINFVMNVTPDCDCVSWSDAPIVGDIGILASKDPVAIDQASLDLVNKSQGLPGTRLEHVGAADKFAAIHGIDGTVQLDHAEEIGLGKREYQLIEV